jgi:Nucleotide modification associated domain 2
LRLYSYVVARDYGFAPNPFFGFCTLATCKPVIRRAASIDDWIVGTGSKERSTEDRLVFVMRVTESLTYDEYWSDPRFTSKRPILRGSKKQAFGDNIYHRAVRSDEWLQADSHHSLANGEPNPNNIAHDTRTNRVLIWTEFAYWGGDGPVIPSRFAELYAGRGHQANFRDGFEEEFGAWFRSLGVGGYLGEPLDWSRTP